MTKTSIAAQGKWRGILVELGVAQEHLTGRHTECPLCGGRDRFRFDDKEGRGTWYCNNCGAGDGMRLAMEFTGKTFREVAQEIDGMVSNLPQTSSPSQASPSAEARQQRILAGTSRPEGINPVSLYLHKRNLQVPVGYVGLNSSVAYFEDGKKVLACPAMVCIITSCHGKRHSLHLTHLTTTGAKAPVSAPKKVLPTVAPLAGCAIRLSPVAPVLGVAEGVETALAVQQMYGIPTWATVNARMMEQFEPPAGVREIRVFADNDKNFTGQKAAYTLANRLSLSGMKATVTVPEGVGDFADILQVRGAA